MRLTTRDHATIRAWAEARDGLPAQVKGSTVLRLGFGKLPPNWEPIEWEQFFEAFDQAGLSFLYDDAPSSRLCKLTHGPRPGPITQR
jgi:hypothetical protein